MKNMRNVLVGAAALLLIGGGCAQQAVDNGGNGDLSSEPLKVGVMVPLSGDAASYGTSVRQGAELAVQELGLENVELVFEDSKCEGKDAAAAVSKLINIDGVDAIIGELCSGATLAAAPVAEGASKVMISPASMAPTVSDAGDYIFRTVPSDASQGLFGAQLAKDRGFERMAVLYTNDDYGVGFDAVLKERAPALGVSVVASEAVERKTVDLRTQLTKIKGANPDVVYIISISPDTAAAALKQIKELELNVAVIGSEGLKADEVVAGAQGGAEGLIVTAVSAGTEAFTAAHNAAYGADPGPFSAQSYDALHALVQAHASEGELKDALYNVSFDGVSGPIAFDENGDIEASYQVFEVKDGAFIAQ